MKSSRLKWSMLLAIFLILMATEWHTDSSSTLSPTSSTVVEARASYSRSTSRSSYTSRSYSSSRYSYSRSYRYSYGYGYGGYYYYRSYGGTVVVYGGGGFCLLCCIITFIVCIFCQAWLIEMGIVSGVRHGSFSSSRSEHYEHHSVTVVEKVDHHEERGPTYGGAPPAPPGHTFPPSGPGGMQPYGGGYGYGQFPPQGQPGGFNQPPGHPGINGPG